MTAIEQNRLKLALRDPDHFVLQITYRDREGTITQRMVSPIRMVDPRTMLALCLCRESPRRFDLDRCTNLELVEAHNVLMPCPMKTLAAS